MTTSSNGFIYGIHEWSIKILKCDVYRQEIGVIENNDLNEIAMKPDGVGGISEFGARAIYGNELSSGAHYYASYNSNDYCRCKKRIACKIGWCTGDNITVILNLRKGHIQFYLNGKKVRKTISYVVYIDLHI